MVDSKNELALTISARTPAIYNKSNKVATNTNKEVPMQAELNVKCGQCGQLLGVVPADTADMPEQLQAKINEIILGHRLVCRYYRQPMEVI